MSSLPAILSGMLAGYAAYKTLPLLPEAWLRERWEPPVQRLAPPRWAEVLFICIGAAAGLLLVRASDKTTVLSPVMLFLPVFAVLLFLLLQISYVDVARRVIPDPHLLAIVLIGVLTLLFTSVDTFLIALRFALSAAVLTLSMAFPALFGRPSPLGLGDVKLFAVLAFLLGALHPSDDLWPALSFLLCAFLLNGLFALLALLFRKTKMTGALPMAPAICLSMLFSLQVF